MAFVKAQWWHVDDKGRRIGWLPPEDFESILEARFGKRQWMKTFATEFGVTYTTVLRYKDGSLPIPKMTAHLVSMLSTLQAHKITLHPLDAPWLPAGTGANALQEEIIDPAIPERR